MEMTILREAAQQALEALECAQQDRECPSTTRQAITALRAALAQQAEPVQEPVAGRAFFERILAAMEGVIDVADRKTDEFDALRSCVIDLTVMLHAAPPQRKPLMEGEIERIGMKHVTLREVIRAVERAHGIKE